MKRKDKKEDVNTNFGEVARESQPVQDINTFIGDIKFSSGYNNTSIGKDSIEEQELNHNIFVTTGEFDLSRRILNEIIETEKQGLKTLDKKDKLLLFICCFGIIVLILYLYPDLF
jgi:hypothetical protein